MSSDPPPVPQPPLPSDGAKPRSKNHGCLIAVIAFFCLAALGVVGICFLGVVLIDAYTATAPATVTAFSPTAEDLRSVERAYQSLRDASVRNEARQINLTERDLNTLIARHPGLRGLRDKVYIQINSSTISLETAVPLAATHFPGLRERWLNLIVSLSFTYEGGNFAVDLQSATANHRDIPDAFLERLNQTFSRSMNEKFHEGLNRDLTVAGFWLQIESIHAEESKLIIKTRGRK